MHVVIINGSPRVAKNSNTDKIIDSFGEGLISQGLTFEKHAISNRNSWDEIREAYVKNENIIFALPLFVECVPGMMLEFLETLPKKDERTTVSFILQSGFAEGCQLRCGEEFLSKLPAYLGTAYGGCLVKGDNFAIRVLDQEKRKQITGPYREMGVIYANNKGFNCEEAKKFTGPEKFGIGMILMLSVVFKTVGKKMYKQVADRWGCTEPLDAKPWK